MSRHLIFAMLALVLILGCYSGCVMKEDFSFTHANVTLNPLLVAPSGASAATTPAASNEN